MDRFPDGGFVRLKSRVRGAYLHADEDGVGVSLNPRRPSVNAAWRVHQIERDGITYVLLHGAAYGRYLTATDEQPASHHLGQRVVQGLYHYDYDDLEESTIMWSVVGAGSRDDVLLRHRSDRLLRANGRHRVWLNGVTTDFRDNRSTMMHWVVEALQPPPAPPALPDPIHDQDRPGGGFLGLFRWHTAPMPTRTIRYVRADDNGNFSDVDWATFQFQGHSLSALRSEVARQVGVEIYNIRVCARAGRNGRLTPLIVDLPRNQKPMDIIALNTLSPAAEELHYPDVDALNIDEP